MSNKIDTLNDNIKIVFSDKYKSTSDTFMLAEFSMPKAYERAMDLGCGCGGIHLWWYAHGYKGKTVAIDIQREVCDLLSESVRLNDLDSQVTVLCADLRGLQDFYMIEKASFDLIVCNPPYYNAGKVSEVKSKSLSNHEVTCTIDDVVHFANVHLKDRGRLCMSYRINRLSDIIVTMRQYRIEPKRIQLDVSGDRAKTFFIEGVKGAKSGGLVCSFFK